MSTRAALLAATGLAAASASRTGAAIPPARALQPRSARRAAPTAVLVEFDFSACLTQFIETGGLQCVTVSGFTERAVVDDVVAGLTGGFVGVTGTVIALELGKQSAKEQLKCEYCSGEGTLKCGECFGVGCKTCAGTGRVACVSCGGSGRAISSELEKQQFRAIFGLFPEMRYGPESTMFDERGDGVTSLSDWDGTISSAQADQARAKNGAQAGAAVSDGDGDDEAMGA
jgi:hypothetical protein